MSHAATRQTARQRFSTVQEAPSGPGAPAHPMPVPRSLTPAPFPALAPSARPMPGDRPRALVVDDEDAVRRVVARVLGAGGFDVVEAQDGEAALAAAREASFDVVLTDITMPRLDGVALLRALRQVDPDVPVILLTGGPTLESAISAVELGAFQYLLKPFDLEQMEASARLAAGYRRMARLQREAIAVAEAAQRDADVLVTLGLAFERTLETLWIAFQPIVRGPDGAIFGYEALSRCSDPELPHIGALLSAAERLGRLPELGRLIRAKAAEAMGPHPERGLLFLNLHPEDLLDPELLNPDSDLARMAHRTVLEVTERAALDDLPDVQRTVSCLRELGYRIAVDDLGAGYAGLTSFATLRPEIVKIDMSLVRDIDGDEVKQRLVRSMVQLSHEMGILVVTEGIETPAEGATCIGLGADLLQGYLIARPGRPFPEVTAG